MTKTEALNKSAQGAGFPKFDKTLFKHFEKNEVELENIIRRAMDIYVSKWISVEDKLPEVDETDDWNRLNKISKDVMTYSKTWGMRFGRYFYNAAFWTVDNVSSSNGIEVEYWKEITAP